MAGQKGQPRGELFFGVDARHIRQLGQELVGDRTTALTELIKNAYDADATEVTLDFQAAERIGGVLEIRDDGSGMSLADIEAGWMRISTPSKDVEARSPKFKRARAGRKGIGRFATETLGKSLTLETTVRGDPSAISIYFDWENDYPSGQDLITIANPFWVEPAKRSDHGTRLRIEGLYDPWDSGPRNRVRRSIRLLQPPYAVAPTIRSKKKPDLGFDVQMLVDGQQVDSSDGDYDDFLESGTARLTASISSKGIMKASVSSPHLRLKQAETFDESFRKVGALKLEASYFVFAKDALGGASLRTAKAMAKEFAGIRLYRDGLRVMPYGEPGNDWLALDELQGKRTTLVPVANRNWFGQVAISRESNDDLRDTASREGLVENQAFSQLREAIRKALVWGASEVGTVRKRKVSTTSERPASRAGILSKTQADLEGRLTESLPANVSQQVIPLVRSAFGGVSPDATAEDSHEAERVAALLDEVELLRVLASLGTSIAVFSHEVRSALTTSAAAISVLGEGRDPVAQLARANGALEELQDLAGYIDAYVSASQRRTRDPQALAAILDEFAGRLSKNLARNVDFKTLVRPPSLRTAPIARSEIDAILINLLTNSVKAMDKEGHPERRVKISATGQDEMVRIRFQDTGAGVDPKIRDRMFEPFVTDTRSPLSELGVGTGIGLTLVKDIAESNGGEVLLGEPDRQYATCIEVRLPRWAKQGDRK
jgi:signal transduction histidine kinase